VFYDFDIFDLIIFLTHDDGGGFGRKDDVEWIHVKIIIKVKIGIKIKSQSQKCRNEKATNRS
jgi:hypothetical protein